MKYNMTWEQYRNRRGGTSIIDFLSDCENENDAIERFEYYHIEPPLDEIRNFFSSPIIDITPVSEVPADLNITADVSNTGISTVSKKSKVTSGSTGN